jgi:hypothetical protein
VDPALATTAAALRDTGQWADIVDRQWRCVYSTDDQRLIYGGLLQPAAVALGSHYFGPEAMRVRLGWKSGPNTPELTREFFAAFVGLVLADTPGGREELSRLVDPALSDIVEGLEPAADAPALPIAWRGNIVGRPVSALTFAIRIHNVQGDRAGTALISKPGAGMAVVATMASAGDPRHFERMQTLAKAGRRPGRSCSRISRPRPRWRGDCQPRATSRSGEGSSERPISA